MTKKERVNPDVINGSRKRRIAAGSGTTTRDVNQLLKQFDYARDLLKKMGRRKIPKNFPFKT
jgi:signal recognition particle subunit SRP54